MQRRAKRDFERYARLLTIPKQLRQYAQQCAEEVKVK